MKYTRSVLFLMVLLIVIGFWGCKKTSKKDDFEQRLIEDNTQRLNNIFTNFTYDNQPSEYESLDREVKFVSGLIKALGEGSKGSNIYKINLDSLLLELQSLPVVATEVTIYRDWLSEKETKRTESVKKLTYNEITDAGSLKRIIEQTNNYSEKRAKSIHDENPDWDKDECISLVEHKIWIGMSKEMLLKSRGRPADINRTVGSWGVHEQWVYGTFGPYLYLEDGILTSWQN